MDTGLKRWGCLLLALGFVTSQVLWQWLLLGGIEAHHFFGDASLPAVSNGWGMLVLLLLAYRVSAQLKGSAPSFSAQYGALLAGLVFGLLLSLLFVLGQQDGILWAIAAVMMLSCWLPLYQTPYLLGYLAGFSLSVGHVMPWLPALPVLAVALVAAKVRQTLQQRRLSRVQRPS